MRKGLVNHESSWVVLPPGLDLVFLCSWKNGSGVFCPCHHPSEKSFYSWLSRAQLFSHSPHLNA